MLKIAICDDEEKERSRTKKMCADCFTAYPEQELKLSVFSSSREFLRLAKQEQFDIVLLDIYMPELTGIELAKELRAMKQECQIVFLTTSMAHAIEAFSLHAAHYLVKPYTTEQLRDALDKALAAVERCRRAQVTLKVTGGIQKICFDHFFFAETERHNQKIYLNDNKIIDVRITSTELFTLLSHDNRFFKCGSTYIINLDKVEEITTQYILFDNEVKIPMLRRQYRDLLERYTGYSLEV